MQSIGSVLHRHRGVAPGFDLLRIAFALGVVVWHARAIVQGDTSPGSPLFELGSYGIIAAFFGLSGFLITASAQRLRLRDFLINRTLRIVPALAVEIVLSALILGPMLTTLPPAAYFSDPHTYRYFSNIVGVISYTLPGVFEDHPTNIVNTSLWTIPHEIACYAIMSAFVLLGVLRRPALVVVAAGLVILLGFALFAVGIDRLPRLPALLADKVLVGHASRLYVAFLLGVAAYLYRHRIPYDGRLLALAVTIVLACTALNLVQRAELAPYPLMNLVALPSLIYVTVFLGVSDLWVPALLRRGDYSYGIYLYGWPLQQLTMSLLPSVRDTAQQVLIAIPVILAFAMVSWHAIERPILGTRRRLSFIAGRRLEEGRPTAPCESASTAA